MKKSIALVLYLVSSSGCSVYGMTRPTTVHEFVSNRARSNETCTSSSVDPIVDTAIAIGAGALMTYGIIQASNATVPATGNPQQDQAMLDQVNGKNYGLAISSGVIASVFGASAIYGYTSAIQCSEAKGIVERAYEARQARAEEEARLEQVRKQEQDRQDVLRKEQEENARQTELRKQEEHRQQEEKAQEAECARTNVSRKGNAKKLEHHMSVQQWVSENCKVQPVFANQCHTSVAFGQTTCSNVKVGDKMVCSLKDRPSKLDGTKLSDEDITGGNFATNHDDVMSWSKDKEQNDLCSKYDTHNNSVGH